MPSFGGFGIKPAIEKAGYKPFMIAEEEFIDKIDERIMAELGRSRFVVADFTHGSDGARGSVYYEAGYAHGLGKPVVYTCHKSLVDRLHFDTRQYNHIIWQEPDDLYQGLYKRICDVIGKGALQSDIGVGARRSCMIALWLRRAPIGVPQGRRNSCRP